jgi:hypothetical protein
MIARFILAALTDLCGRLSGWVSNTAALSAALAAALGIAWLRGRAAGTAAWQKKRQAVHERALRKSGEIRHDMQNDSDAGLDHRLDRWMRD